MNDHQETYDEKVGKNLRGLRIARGLTQEQLSTELAVETGVPFTQQTIVKIEKGQRPLRLREADALARTMKIDIDMLVSADPVAEATILVARHTEAVIAAGVQLGGAVEEFMSEKASLRAVIDQVEGTDVDEGTVERARHELRVLADPYEIVKFAIARFSDG